MKKFIILVANSQRYFIHALRVGIFIAFLIGVVQLLFMKSDYLSYAGAVFAIVVVTMNLLGIWFYKVGLIGGLLIAIVSSVGLVWTMMELMGDVYPEGQYAYFLSKLGRFTILLSCGLICASDAAKQIFRQYVLRMGKA